MTVSDWVSVAGAIIFLGGCVYTAVWLRRARRPSRDQLAEALREELVMLWSDLGTRLDYAMVANLNPLNERSGWSIEMLSIADRIAEVTELVGSPSWENISVRLLLDGWWDAVHRRAGLPVPAFDRDRAEEVRESHRA